MNATKLTTTFAVSDVTPAAEPLPELPVHEAVAAFLGCRVEACSRYHGTLLDNVCSHPLIAALHGAFTGHRPLVLSPDIIWLTITHGLAIHINKHAERLRPHFVEHAGQLKIIVQRDDFVKGSPENPWPEVFGDFSAGIRRHIGSWHDLIVADFSTTGPVERAASEITLMDAMGTYFDYELQTLCGIPSITLEGTTDDWRSIAARVHSFAELGLERWVNSLEPILEQFVAAAGGRVNHSFWDSIYKYNGPDGSGSPFVSGWVNMLFPYVRDWDWDEVRFNPWIDAESPSDGPLRSVFPNNVARAPFNWVLGMPPNEVTFDMEFIGGLVGVAQDAESLALRPEIGWAVRDTSQAEACDSSEELSELTDPFVAL